MMSDTVRSYRSLSDIHAKDYPIRNIFQNFFPEYASVHSVSGEQSKAARCISECKTGALGYNVSFCEVCGHIEIHACSCNNRNCPCCQSPQEQKWIMARNSELIENCAYYHCIFTVPYELNDLIFDNQRRKSSAFGHQTLLISYHRINFIENVTIECIDGNWMRGVPLRCPYLYIIKKNKFVSCFLLLINLLYEEI